MQNESYNFKTKEALQAAADKLQKENIACTVPDGKLALIVNASTHAEVLKAASICNPVDTSAEDAAKAKEAAAKKKAEDEAAAKKKAEDEAVAKKKAGK